MSNPVQHHKKKIFDQSNDSFQSYHSYQPYQQQSTTNTRNQTGRSIGNMEQMIQRTEREIIQSNQNTNINIPQNLFTNFYSSDNRKTPSTSTNQNSNWISKQEISVIQQNIERLIKTSIEGMRQENEGIIQQFMIQKKQQDTENIQFKNQMSALQQIETRINQFELENQQNQRLLDKRLLRLEDSANEIKEQLISKNNKLIEMEKMIRQNKMSSDGRQDEFKKKVLELEIKLSDCVTDNERIQRYQANNFNQMNTKMIEYEELLKIQQGMRKSSNNDRESEEEIIQKVKMMQNEYEQLNKLFFNFQNDMHQTLDKHKSKNNQELQQLRLQIDNYQNSQSSSAQTKQQNQIEIEQHIELEQQNDQQLPIMRRSYEFIPQEVVEKQNEEGKNDDKDDEQQINNFGEFMDRTQKITENPRQLRESYTIPDQQVIGSLNNDNNKMNFNDISHIEQDHRIDINMTDEDELVYKMDENGYLMDDKDNYILDQNGQMIKLNEEHISYLENNNLIEDE